MFKVGDKVQSSQYQSNTIIKALFDDQAVILTDSTIYLIIPVKDLKPIHIEIDDLNNYEIYPVEYWRADPIKGIWNKNQYKCISDNGKAIHHKFVWTRSTIEFLTLLDYWNKNSAYCKYTSVG
jgi:hypothetical protein